MVRERLREESRAPLPEELVESLNKLNIDAAFVLPPEHRPKSAVAAGDEDDDIPVIDLAGLWGGDEAAKASIVDQVGRASAKWGFFQVINHGVALSLLDDLETQAKKFFDLPREEKYKIRRGPNQPMGYYDSELTKNTRDWKEVFDWVVKERVSLPSEFDVELQSRWPEGQEKLRDSCRKWVQAMEVIANKILELLSLSLGLPGDSLHQFFGEDQTSVVRLNYYRKCPIPDLVLGVSGHKDQGALTVLVQDEVGGLEVRRKDGQWVRVEPRRDALVINIGDLMQVWSNDKYESVEHRVVVNENRDRFSCPFFLFPSYSAEVYPLITSEKEPPRYRKFTWGEFDKAKKDSNYKNLGLENVQVYHYAIV